MEINIDHCAKHVYALSCQLCVVSFNTRFCSVLDYVFVPKRFRIKYQVFSSLVTYNIRNTEEAPILPNTPLGPWSVWWPRGVLWPEYTASNVFLFLLSNYIHVYAIIMQYFSYIDKTEILQQGNSIHHILPSPHFRWVVI